MGAGRGHDRHGVGDVPNFIKTFHFGVTIDGIRTQRSSFPLRKTQRAAATAPFAKDCAAAPAARAIAGATVAAARRHVGRGSAADGGADGSAGAGLGQHEGRGRGSCGGNDAVLREGGNGAWDLGAAVVAGRENGRCAGAERHGAIAADCRESGGVQSGLFYKRTPYIPRGADASESDIQWARLPGGEDWALIPVQSDPPLCTLKELQDGTYDLADLQLMVDAVMVKADNREIMNELVREQARRG